MAALIVSTSKSSWLGLVQRRTRWGLSVRGKLLLCIVVSAMAFVVLHKVQSFLAVSEPMPAEHVIVEGWIPLGAVHFGVTNRRDSLPTTFICVGGPVPDHWPGMSNGTYADWGKGKLKRLGIPLDRIVVAPSAEFQQDRTYHSALAAREWFRSQKIYPNAINVLTQGPHARRSRLLFEKAFGPGVKVGVIAAPNGDYDPQRWWRSSEGVKDVLGETIGYLYARFLFTPED